MSSAQLTLRTVIATATALAALACAPAGDEAGPTTTTTPAPTTTDPTTTIPLTTSTEPPHRPPRALVIAPTLEPDPTEVEQPVDDGVPVADLVAGDCIDFADLVEGAEGEIEVVARADCATPHDAEVYATISLDDDPASRHPGDEHVLAAADRVCLDAFEGYVGARYVDTRLEIVHLRPTVASWARQDRRVICMVVNAAAAPLEASVAGMGSDAA